ncbi:MAG TPA: PHP domain-containing protein [Candidatus Limnocylindrales bacterium]|nr:PHP domain-containing protein [Candidatus Limnocylindrales bacterium]
MPVGAWSGWPASSRSDPLTSLRRNRYDFHAHSARSDGVLPPAELYAAMTAAGLRAAAITDHDSLAAPVELWALGLGGPDRAPGSGPRLISGVEINTLPGAEAAPLPEAPVEVHILGLGVDPAAPALTAALERQRHLRRERIERMAQRLRALGLPIDEQLATTLGPEVAAPGRPHLARALIRTGLATSVDDAFDRYLSRGRPAYVPRTGLGPREAVEAIVAAGGLAVLAHTADAPDRAAFVGRLQDWGLGGLEVHYGGMGRPYTAEQVDRLARFAAERGLLASGGTDYHGDTMSYGEAIGLTHVPDAAAEAILAAAGV